MLLSEKEEEPSVYYNMFDQSLWEVPRKINKKSILCSTCVAVDIATLWSCVLQQAGNRGKEQRVGICPWGWEIKQNDRVKS